jgi:hypothetical protein
VVFQFWYIFIEWCKNCHYIVIVKKEFSLLNF